MEKENEKAKVDDERPVDVVVGHVASLALAFHQIRMHVDPYADDHLK